MVAGAFDVTYGADVVFPPPLPPAADDPHHLATSSP
jgi:hypothetical protein